MAKSKRLTATKLERLSELAQRLGQLRTKIWNEFGSLKGVNLTHRQIRDNWLATNKQFDIPARLWKETLRDVMDNIHLYCEAAKEKVKKVIPKRYRTKIDRWTLYKQVKSILLERSRKRLGLLNPDSRCPEEVNGDVITSDLSESEMPSVG